jgi:hypothetical protein
MENGMNNGMPALFWNFINDNKDFLLKIQDWE